nr:hypothetical protein BHI3_30450 [Bacteriovorax sp. HI3]
MKTTPILLTFTLLFSACSTPLHQERDPATAKPESCKEIVTSFLAPSRFNGEAFAKKMQIEATTDELSNLFYAFRDIDLNTLNDEEIRTMRAIYLFSQGDKTLRDELAAEFIKTVKGEAADLKNKNWDRFLAHKKKIDKYRAKKIATAKSAEDKLSLEKKVVLYEKLYMSCKSHVQKKPTPADLRLAKKLTWALTAGSMTSTAVTYAYTHKDEEKDSKWMKGMYFELALSGIFTYVGGTFVTSNPRLNPWTVRAPLTYFNAAVADLGPSGAYSYFFNDDNKEMQKKFETMKNDPKLEEEVAELLHFAQENGLFEKHLAATEKLFKQKPHSKMSVEEIKKSLDINQVDLEESRELLFEAMSEKEYQDNAGTFQTGDSGLDRYTFHRLWTLGSVPYNIGFALLMHNQMCMTTDPKAGFAKAVGTYFAGQLLSDVIYYKTRQKTINQ